MTEELFKDVSTKAAFDELSGKAGDLPVFVDFYATWCGKCEMLTPELEEIAKANHDKAVYIKIDVEANEEVADMYKVECLPTLICIKNGDKIGEMKGSKVDNFKNFMSTHLK